MNVSSAGSNLGSLCDRGGEEDAVAFDRIERAGTYEAFARMLVLPPDNDVLEAYACALADANSDALAIGRLAPEVDGEELHRWDYVKADRTRLVQGYDPAGPRPPLQSLFDESGNAVRGQVLQRYRNFGFQLDAEVHASSDHLGVELLYIAALLRRSAEEILSGRLNEIDQLDEEVESFRQNNVLPLALGYADEMERWARTEFFRCFAACLRKFVIEDCAA